MANRNNNQATAEKAYNLLAGICESRGIKIILMDRGWPDKFNAEGSLVYDKHIIIDSACNMEKRLDVLLDLLAQREIKGKEGVFHSILGKRQNVYALLAKILLCELLAESEVRAYG